MSKELLHKLEADGWQKRFSVSGPRLQEAIDNYIDLGFEVKTVPLKDIETENCDVCFTDENDDTVMIFTRKIDDEKNRN